MVVNVGKADRVVRVVLGVGLLSLLFLGEGPVRWLGLIGFVPLATAFIGWCPAYSLFGMSTCKPKSA
jgi:Protein of unknown function (DUF2892)